MSGFSSGRDDESGGAEVWFHGDAPLIKQPFGDVTSVSVLFAPPVQLRRVDIELWGQS